MVVARTPEDYHRIVSPTLKIDTDSTVSLPVGILACQRDPLLRVLETTIVSVSLSQQVSSPPAKKAKKAVLAPSLPAGPILEVILHDTVIFPEGGGQPSDTGSLRGKDGSTWTVAQCKRHGGHAVHYVVVPSNLTSDAAIEQLAPGTAITASLDQADWDRRWDHMSLHTSQHLLSALLETRLNLPTLSWSLTASPSPCYVEIPRGMEPEEVQLIQDEANRLVYEGHNVYVEVQELDQDQDHSKVVTLESGRAVGKGLPTDYTGGVKRVVVIEGVDSNPCCGTHMPSLKNLQLFIFPHTDALSRSNTTSARLYFVAGPRLITHLTSSHNLLTATSTTLSCGAPLVPERVAQLSDERRRADKRVQDTESELAQLLAQGLFTEFSASPENQSFKKHIHRTDDASNTLGFLSAISLAFDNLAKESARNYLLVLSSSPSASSQTNSNVVVVLGSIGDQVKSTGEALKAELGAKGGGKPPRWSGKTVGVWKESMNSKIENILTML